MDTNEERYIERLERRIKADEIRRNYMREIIKSILQRKHMHNTDVLLCELIGLLDILKQDLPGDRAFERGGEGE